MSPPWLPHLFVIEPLLQRLHRTRLLRVGVDLAEDGQVLLLGMLAVGEGEMIANDAAIAWFVTHGFGHDLREHPILILQVCLRRLLDGRKYRTQADIAACGERGQAVICRERLHRQADSLSP